MAFLIANDTIRIINNDNVALTDRIPAGIYKYCFHPKEGSWLEPYKYNTSHSKIYGDSAKIANHIIKRYELNESKDNMGVLLSGGKGLGKSLTVRLVVEKLKTQLPIIIVDAYTPDLPDFLCQVYNSVIIMDEFDKFMKGGTDEDGNQDNNEMTKQESLLSTLDGVGNKLNNLYLLTCNDTKLIDTNFISRPGRIKYHYKFTSISGTAIRAYCKDNLDDKSKIDEVVSTLEKIMYVSFDIVKAVVEELNLFDVDIASALDYLNITKPIKDIIATLSYEYYDEESDKWEEKDSTEHYYDTDLNSAIAFYLGRTQYIIDLEKLDFSKGVVVVPTENIITESKKPNDKIRNLRVKLSFLGAEHIIGKSARYCDY